MCMWRDKLIRSVLFVNAAMKLDEISLSMTCLLGATPACVNILCIVCQVLVIVSAFLFFKARDMM